MLINRTSVLVDDQEKALRFYTAFTFVGESMRRLALELL